MCLERCLRMRGAASLVVVAVLLTVPAGCGRGGDGPAEPPPARQGTQPDGTVVEGVAAGPENLDEEAGTADAPGAAAADVIRTRIAWREHTEGGTPWPTPTPASPVPVTATGGVVWASEIGLMWSEDAVGVFEFRDAEAYCEGLLAAGFEDWRMPTLTEIELLLATSFRPAWVGEVGVLWSSTPYEHRGVVTLEFPERSTSHQEVGMAHVLCVRALE